MPIANNPIMTCFQARVPVRVTSGGLRRFLAVLIGFLLLACLPAAAFGEQAESAEPVKDFAWYRRAMTHNGTCSVFNLIDAAGLAEGDPSKACQDMVDYAVQNGLAGELLLQIGDMLEHADPSEQSRKISNYVASRYVESGTTHSYRNPTEVEQARFAAADTQRTEPAAIWETSGFEEVFGIAFDRFKPLRPQPGLCLAVIKASALYRPGRAYNDTLETAQEVLNNLKPVVSACDRSLQSASLSFTGNPNLASVVILFDIQYSFYGNYGNAYDPIKGYGAIVTLTALDARTHRKIASVKMKHELGGMISVKSGGIYEDRIYCASLPTTTAIDIWQPFEDKLAASVNPQSGNDAYTYAVTEGNAELIVSILLNGLAGKASDPWQKAIYEAGAQAVRMDGDTLSLRLRSFDPALESLGAYADNPDTWLSDMLQNAAAYNLNCTLTIDEDGKLLQSSETPLKAAVKKAAAAVGKAYGNKDVLTALRARLFPVPIEGEAESDADVLNVSPAFTRWVQAQGEALQALTPTEWAPLYFAQDKQTLGVDKGPHALQLKCEGISPGLTLSAAYQDARAAAISDPTADLRTLFLRTLAGYALHPGKGLTKTFTVALDVEELSRGALPDDYQRYLDSYEFAAQFSRMEESVSAYWEEHGGSANP